MRFHPSIYRSISLGLGLLFALQTLSIPFGVGEDVRQPSGYEFFWKLFSKVDVAESKEEKKGETLEHEDKKEEIKYGHSQNLLQAFYLRQQLIFASFRTSVKSPYITIQAPPPKFG